MSPGSMEDVVFMLQVNRRDRGLESRNSSLGSPDKLLEDRDRTNRRCQQSNQSKPHEEAVLDVVTDSNSPSYELESDLPDEGG